MPLSLSPSLLMSSASSVAFSPLSLFASGEQGAWYDPSDLSTMFQDTAGTTPVTATGQTVARINDKSGRGNHATQATAASRPIYGIEPFGGRRNLLTYTEQFDNAAWMKSDFLAFGSGSFANTLATTDPIGTNTADLLVENTTTSQKIVQTSFNNVGGNYAFSCYVKSAGRNFARFKYFDSGNNRYGAVFNLLTGAVTNDPNTIGGVITSSSAVDAGNGWWRLLIIGNAPPNAFSVISISTATSATTTSQPAESYTGNGTSGIYIWGAQLETGSTATAYQRVTDQWNVTQAGVPSVSYLAFDGTDDFLLTGTITPGTDKAQVFAGVRKLSDAAGGMLAELSAFATTAGSFRMEAPSGAFANYGFASRGSAGAFTTATTYTAPITNVVTGLGDISADSCLLRANGVQVGSSTADQGTGNYSANPLYIGRRAGTSLPFNGRIYGLAVRFGANLSAAQISQMETWLNARTGAF